MSRIPAWENVWVRLAAAAIAAIGLALLLAWTSNRGFGVAGWIGFLAALVLSGLGSWVAWRSLVRREAGHASTMLPGWLAGAFLLAVVLRLGAGVLWYLTLPVYGHQSPAEQAGYVMVDAYTRDQAAWELSQSDSSLLATLREYRRDDQYGGFLFLSAVFYRYLGGSGHHPLQIVVLCAIFSALSVLFTWGLVRRAWPGGSGQAAAGLAAWGLALYPEAVLQGSSQMREAFTVTLVVAAFYHLVCYFQENRRTSLLWLVGCVVASLPLSPPLTAALVALLALAAPVIPQNKTATRPGGQIRGDRKYGWWVLVGLLLLGLAGLGFGLEQFGRGDTQNPLQLAQYWLKKSAELQALQAERTSGKLQALFDRLPPWSHILVLVGYGVVQPFLPAALVAVSNASIWQWIAIWRAVGWSILLAFLVYAPLRAVRRGEWLSLVLALQVWGVTLVASFRGGGDQWDNPRYRAAFAAVQVSLAAWAWVDQRRQRDPWMRRLVWAVGSILFWFIPWYLNRYSGLPWLARDIFKTFGLGIATACLLWIADWARHARAPDQEPPTPTPNLPLDQRK